MEWIDASKELPDHQVDVFIKQKHEDSILIGWLDKNKQSWIEQCENMVVHGDAWTEQSICNLNSDECWRVTHWLPMSALPQPPK